MEQPKEDIGTIKDLVRYRLQIASFPQKNNPIQIIVFCKDLKSVQEIMDEFGFDSRTSFRRKYLTPMLENGVLKMTIPEKPSSKNQKYFS